MAKTAKKITDANSFLSLEDSAENWRLNPLNDYLFIKMMGEKGDEEQLLSFLNAVLADTRHGRLQSLEIRENKKLSAKIIGDKTSILDIAAITDDGTKVNVEVQVRNLKNMDKRSLFYWARDFASDFSKGSNYQNLPPVIAINLLDFDFLGGENYHTTFHLWDDATKKIKLTDALEIHFLEMPKFRAYCQNAKNKILQEPLARWLLSFDRRTPMKTLDEVITLEPAIGKAMKRMRDVRRSPSQMRAYEMREMGKMDFRSAVSDGREEGRAEGINIGVERGKVEGWEQCSEHFIRSMKQNGLSVVDISKIAGLPVSRIAELCGEKTNGESLIALK